MLKKLSTVLAALAITFTGTVAMAPAASADSTKTCRITNAWGHNVASYRIHRDNGSLTDTVKIQPIWYSSTTQFRIKPQSYAVLEHRSTPSRSVWTSKFWSGGTWTTQALKTGGLYNARKVDLTVDLYGGSAGFTRRHCSVTFY